MHFSKTLVLAAASTTSAATIQVAVGDGGLKFTPNNFAAAVGDQVVFTFHAKNHSVTQSSFSDPCHPLEGGFFSTFQPTTAIAANQFTLTVANTKPIWLYCGQTTGNHCQSGMTAAINAPKTGNTFEAYQLLAKNATTSTSPPNGLVAGGILAAAAGSSGSSSSASASGTGSSMDTVRTVTTSILSTVTATVTSAESTFTTTYASSFATTYTTAASQTVAVQSSTSSQAAQQTSTSGAEKQVVIGAYGVAAAAAAFALGML